MSRASCWRKSRNPLPRRRRCRKVGPYHVLAPLSADGEVLLGYDTKLMRRVWIRQVPADAAPVAASIRHTARPGRLRWLQGQRDGANSWDAYEAAPGTPLTALLHTPQPWRAVRHWLLDLTTEFTDATTDGSLPATLALDRVWITASGGAKLLDFPAPGSGSSPALNEINGADPAPLLEPAVFLKQLAISALEGRVVTADEARTAELRVPAAIRARSFLRGLGEVVDFRALAAQLAALVQQRPEISHLRRLGLVAGCVVPTLFIGGITVVSLLAFSAWEKSNPDLLKLRTALAIYSNMERGKFPPGVKPAIGLEPAETFIAGRFGPLVRNPSVWAGTYGRSFVPAPDRQLAERIVAKFDPLPSAEAVAQARARLGRAIDADGELNIGKRFSELPPTLAPMAWPATALGGFLWAAFFSLAAALLFRGGLLMRALGIAVVTRDGADASRGRMLWRACVAWSWMPLGIFIAALLVPALHAPKAFGLVGLIVVVVAVYSAARRGRSLPDLLAGTWLVPR